MVGGHSIVDQVVPQNKFVFVLLDRLVVLFFVAGLMLNPTDVWMGNIFRWKFLGDASMAARKELAPTKCTINLHLQHLEQQDFDIFPFNNLVLDLALGHISENTQFVYGERKSI